MSDQELLDWQKLHNWAEGKPEGYEVGQSCTNSQCPIALYLFEQTGKLWSVGPAVKRMDGSGKRLDKPVWVSQLIYYVDFAGGKAMCVPITREEFLAVLKVVKPLDAQQ